MTKLCFNETFLSLEGIKMPYEIDICYNDMISRAKEGSILYHL